MLLLQHGNKLHILSGCAVLALQDIVGIAPSPQSEIGTYISNGVGGFLPGIFQSAGIDQARTIVAGGAAGRVCIGGDTEVGCFNIAANGTATLANAVSTGADFSSEAIIVDALGDWLLVSIVTRSSIQVYSIDAVTSELSFASKASVDGVPRGLAMSPNNQNLVVVLSDSDTVSVRPFDPVTGTLPSSPSPTSHAVGSNPFRVVVGILTGSSPFGYAVTNKDSRSLSLLPGDDTGPTGPPADYDVGCSPWSIAASDLDGDNDTDIVIGCFASPPLTVLLNISGQGGFVASNP